MLKIPLFQLTKCGIFLAAPADGLEGTHIKHLVIIVIGTTDTAKSGPKSFLPPAGLEQTGTLGTGPPAVGKYPLPEINLKEIEVFFNFTLFFILEANNIHIHFIHPRLRNFLIYDVSLPFNILSYICKDQESG